MEKNTSNQSLKNCLYAFAPLAVFYIAAGLAGGCMELIGMTAREKMPAFYNNAADLYTMSSLWSVLRLVIPAGTGFLAVRPQYLAEKTWFYRGFLKENMSLAGRASAAGQGSEAAKAGRALFVLMAGTSALSLGINVLFSCLGIVSESSAFSSGLLPGPAGILLEASVYGLYMPFIEEMLFRGILFSRLYRLFGRAAAAVFSSLIFGLYHWNPAQGAYAFVMGLVFALAYEKTGRIEVPWALHGTCNMMVMVLSWTDTYRRVCTSAWGAGFLAIAAGGYFSLFLTGFFRGNKKH